MEHSDSITKICGALRIAQKNIDHVEKTSTNPHFGNSYTDLNAFIRAVRDPLDEVGITMTQAPGMQDGWVTVETLLVHDSGEWMKAVAGAPMQKADPQGVGSAITYLRRYSLASLLAIPQEDDDGNAASHKPDTGKRREPARRGSGQSGGPACPDCGGGLWNNIEKKASGDFSAKSPDFSCKDKDGCGWVLWLDSAQEKIQTKLDQALDGGLISEDQHADTTESLDAAATDGDLDQLRITSNWIRNVAAAKTGADAEAAGSGV